jgi:L-alanine-DL-glutamate epimerase-like enolase superfamily enzyme
MNFRHAARTRAICDSVIVALRAENGKTGWGEAVFRDNVGGLPAPPDRLLATSSAIVVDLLLRLAGTTMESIRGAIRKVSIAGEHRPLLCAVEAALFSLWCESAGENVFAALDRAPVRDRVRYSAVVPMADDETKKRLFEQVGELNLPSLRLKLCDDETYNQGTLALAREILGELELRVDANSSWTRDSAPRHVRMCRENRVRYVEDPAPAKVTRRLGSLQDEELIFVADEALIGEGDLASIARHRHYRMLNFRLSKNGGMLRTLAMESTANEQGLPCCVCAHPGETGILSALGRIAASVVSNPLFVDGSYDSILLSDNITRLNYDFGPGGWAPTMETEGIGYDVDPRKVDQYAAEHIKQRLSQEFRLPCR